MAGVQGSRTLRAHRRAHASGFEVREAHRDPSTPALCSNHDVKAYVRFVGERKEGRLMQPPFTFIALDNAAQAAVCNTPSSLSFKMLSGTAPTTCSTGLPLLKISNVGMLRTP